jgi:hypothetical protein
MLFLASTHEKKTRKVHNLANLSKKTFRAHVIFKSNNYSICTQKKVPQNVQSPYTFLLKIFT